MKGRLFYFMLLAMNLLSFVSVAKRPFLSTDAMSHQDPKHAPAPALAPYQTIESKKVRESIGMSNMKIGSSPPSCDHKCYGCKPCEATQVPSKSSRRSHLRLEYANYEPESWKCKCGPSFYSP